MDGCCSARSRRGSRRTTSWRRCAGPSPGDEGRACRNARSVRDGAPGDPGRASHPGAALPDGVAEDLPGRGAAGLDVTTGDRDGELVETGRMPESLEIPVGPQLQTPPAYSAVKVGGRRAYELARPGRRPSSSAPDHGAPSGSPLARGRPRRVRDRCSSGTYVRSLVTDLGDAYCDELERTAIGPFRLEDADPERLIPLARGAGVPARAPAVRRGGRVRPSRPADSRARERHGHTGSHTKVRCSPSAEPVGDGEFQPVVVFAPA